jgi:hypothetical protein
MKIIEKVERLKKIDGRFLIDKSIIFMIEIQKNYPNKHIIC